MITGILVGFLLVAFGTVYALNYDGESYCREHPAWPNGTYLGQMHRQHIDHYIKHFGEAGACERWAADQQASAVRGLRQAGYQVVKVKEPIPYEQNCGDRSVIPVEWEFTQVPCRWGLCDALDNNFVLDNADGPAYRDIPYVLTLYDEHMNVLDSYKFLHFAVAANSSFELQSADMGGDTLLLRKRGIIERLRCVTLTIDRARARKWFASSQFVGTVSTLSYDGTSYCQDHPAWPNGTYLGQMHQQHIDHYVDIYGEDTACERWASDQQASAAAGLRRAGYQVVRIEESIPYEQNCGDLSAIPVGWKITIVSRFYGSPYENLHINFVFNNTGGPAYTSIPHTVIAYDKHMNEIMNMNERMNEALGRDLSFGTVGENGRFELTNTSTLGQTWLIRPVDVARLQDGGCLKLTIDLDRAQRWESPAT